jgi:hypothetical protein
MRTKFVAATTIKVHGCDMGDLALQVCATVKGLFQASLSLEERWAKDF